MSFNGRGIRSTRRKPPTCRKSLTNFITYCYVEYNSPWTEYELATLVVIVTDCRDSCKSNYHRITTTKAPYVIGFLGTLLCFTLFTNLYTYIDAGATSCNNVAPVTNFCLGRVSEQLGFYNRTRVQPQVTFIYLFVFELFLLYF